LRRVGKEGVEAEEDMGLRKKWGSQRRPSPSSLAAAE
jgi:hypothetical protein